MKSRQDYLAFGTPDFTDAEINAVSNVLRSGWVGMGSETIAFEKELAEYIGVSEIVSVNSCTSALFLALLIEGIGKGDEVIVPSLTWCATANVVLYLGATPVFCDVDGHTMSMTSETISQVITDKTKAVIVVHYGGLAVDVDVIKTNIPDKIVIIEDAAHAIGAKYPNGKLVGASGNSVCFSFYANKNLSTADGGAIALFDTEKAEHLRSLRMSGMRSNAWSRYVSPTAVTSPDIVELGYKMNYTDLQAAIGRVQLKRLDEMALVRYEIAKHYQKLLEGNDLYLLFQSQVFEKHHARHLLVICLNPMKVKLSRDEIILELKRKNIGVGVHYRPLHLQSLYSNGYAAELPVTEMLGGQILTLPISASMTLSDVKYVVDNFIQLIKNMKAK